MRAEIGEPLQRERRAEREELPPVEGCGYSDPSFDPLAEWKAREAAKPKAKTEYGSIMPGVEAMPNWRQFVGWVEPTTPEKLIQSQPVLEPAKPEASAEPTTSKLSESNEVKDDVEKGIGSSIKGAGETAATVVELELPSFEDKDEPSLDLGNLDMASVIAAAASAVDDEPSQGSAEPAVVESVVVSDQSVSQSTLVVTLDEPSASLDELTSDPPLSATSAVGKDSTMVVTLDEPTASLAPESSAERKVDLVVDDPSVPSSPSALRPVPLDVGLSAKLASVRPLAHPGRLPRKFELSEAEKEVLRLCNGHRTTQSILDSDINLDGSQLSAFMRRCAQVKLVTFKR